MRDEHLNCTKCPECGAKLQTKDSRPHESYGFSTMRRRKVCPSCDYRVNTVEILESVSNEVFGEAV